MTAAETVLVADDPERHAYEVRVDGAVAGHAYYTLAGARITFTHTEVAEEFGGRGLAGRLARFALDDARARGLAVRPRCPFFRSWIDRHPDYADLVR